MWKFNGHSRQRAAQRNLSPDELGYVMCYGQRFHRAGALIYYLRRRDVPEWDRADDRWMKLVGTAVVLTKDGRTVLTTWRNRRNGLKHIKRKPLKGGARMSESGSTGDWARPDRSAH